MYITQNYDLKTCRWQRLSNHVKQLLSEWNLHGRRRLVCLVTVTPFPPSKDILTTDFNSDGRTRDTQQFVTSLKAILPQQHSYCVKLQCNGIMLTRLQSCTMLMVLSINYKKSQGALSNETLSRKGLKDIYCAPLLQGMVPYCSLWQTY